jgi:hypothetical protein
MAKQFLHRKVLPATSVAEGKRRRGDASQYPAPYAPIKLRLLLLDFVMQGLEARGHPKNRPMFRGSPRKASRSFDVAQDDSKRGNEGEQGRALEEPSHSFFEFSAPSAVHDLKRFNHKELRALLQKVDQRAGSVHA